MQESPLMGSSAKHAQQSAQPPPQTLGDYELLEKIGQGGMGSVFRARHVRLGKQVAIKVLPPHLTDDASAISRFEREMLAVGQLEHPNIVQAHDAREEAGTHFLVMQLVGGIDVAALSSRRGPLPVPEACEIVRQAALGLQHAFEHGLVHRDIKPSNLLLSPKGIVKILDMGLALLQEDDVAELTSTGQVMGTLDYIAPEQIASTHNVDIRADLYSLGCTLYKLLTGSAPFSGPNYSSPLQKMRAHEEATAVPLGRYRDDIPPGLVPIIDRLLSKNPADRFETPSELAAVMAPLCVGCNLVKLLNELPAEVSMPAVAEPVSSPPATASHVSKGGLTETVLDTSVPSDATMPEPSLSFPLVESGLAERVRRRRESDRIPWKPVLGFLALAALLIGGIYGGQIIRVVTGKGLLVIEADDRDIEVTITRESVADPVTIVDKATDRTYTLDVADDYYVTITEPATGQSFKSKQFTITRGGKKVFDVRALQRDKPDNPVDPPLTPGPPPTVAGTQSPAAGVPDSEGGFALSFNGEDNSVEIPSYHFDGSHPFTMEAWCIPASETHSTRTVIYSGCLFRLVQLKDWSATARVSQNESYLTVGGEKPKPDQRSHVAAVYDEKQIMLFVDGVRQPSYLHSIDGKLQVHDGSPAMVLKDSAGPKISHIGPKFAGIIDEVRFSKRARYSTDFTPAQRFEADDDTLALYHFDEGHGTTLTDASGNGHHGTIHGATWVNADGSALAVPSVAELHRRAAEAVLRAGGKVNGKDTLPAGRFSVHSVDFSKIQEIPDDVWPAVARAKSLQLFYGTDSGIDDAALEQLSGLDAVATLYLLNTNITDQGVATVAKWPRLNALHIAYNDQITDGCCPQIATIPRLRFLDLSVTNVTDHGIERLADCKHLISLALHRCRQITDAGIAHLSRYESLMFLYLAGSPISDDCLADLARCSLLRYLDINDTQISAAGAARLQESLPDCVIVHAGLPPREADQIVARWALEGGGQVQAIAKDGSRPIINAVTDNFFAVWGIDFPEAQLDAANFPSLADVKGIERFGCRGLKNADRGADVLSHMDSLHHVRLSSSDLTDAGLAKLTSLKNLDLLELGGCRSLTGSGFEAFAGSSSLVRIATYHTALNDDGLKAIGRLTMLTELALGPCPNITNAGLEHLTGIEQIRYISLVNNPQLTDEAVPILSRMKSLRFLPLTGTSLTADGIAKLQQALPDCFIEHESLNVAVSPATPTAALTREQAVERIIVLGGTVSVADENAGGTVRTVAGANEIQEDEWPWLHLDMTKCNTVTPSDLQAIFSAISDPRVVWMPRTGKTDDLLPIVAELGAGSDEMTAAEDFDGVRPNGLRQSGILGIFLSTDASNEHLAMLTPLRWLDGVGCNNCEKLNDQALHALALHPNIDHFRVLLFNNTQVTDEGVAHIASKAPTLRSFSLGTTRITDKSLSVLVGLRDLDALQLQETDVSDTGLDALTNPKLKSIDVRQTAVTRDGIARFRQQHPDCTIHWDGGTLKPGEASGETDLGLLFDGVDDFVDVPSLTYDGGPCTVEGWVRISKTPAPGETGWLAGFGQDMWPGFHTFSNGNGFVWSVSVRTPQLDYYNVNTRSDVPQTLQHIAGVYDGKTLQIFVDGVKGENPVSKIGGEEVPEVITPGHPENQRPATTIGGSNVPDRRHSLGGLITELRISSTARYLDDFTPAARFEPDEQTLALYHFDEGTGDQLLDSSGHGHHGTIQGATWRNSNETADVAD